MYSILMVVSDILTLPPSDHVAITLIITIYCNVNNWETYVQTNSINLWVLSFETPNKGVGI